MARIELPTREQAPTETHEILDEMHQRLGFLSNGLRLLEKMPRQVTGAYLLADASQKPLQFTQKGGVLDVQLPDKALDPIATVLVLNTK